MDSFIYAFLECSVKTLKQFIIKLTYWIVLNQILKPSVITDYHSNMNGMAKAWLLTRYCGELRLTAVIELLLD